MITMAKEIDTVLYNHLVEYGLVDKEARAYLSLLEIGQATATNLAKKTGLNRSTTYVILESLKERGLVSVSADKVIQEYIAATPETLVNLAESQLKQQQAVTAKLKNIIPRLNSIKKDLKHKPLVTVYEGKSGIINAFEDSLQSKEKVVRIMSSANKLYELIPDYIGTYAQKRAACGLKMKGIHPRDEHSDELLQRMPKGDESVVIPADKYHISAEVAVYDNKVSYVLAEDRGVAIVIESEEMANATKHLFDLAWEEAKRLNATLNDKKKKSAKKK